MYEKTDFFEFSKTNIGMSSFTDEFLWVGFQNWVPVDMFYTTSHCQMSNYTSLKYPQIFIIFMSKICGLMILRADIEFKVMFMIHMILDMSKGCYEVLPVDFVANNSAFITM